MAKILHIKQHGKHRYITAEEYNALIEAGEQLEVLERKEVS